MPPTGPITAAPPPAAPPPGALYWVVLVAGGVVAGISGRAGGITSLVAYPLLLAVGIPPLTADTTGSVAMLGSGIGSALQRGRGRWSPSDAAALAARTATSGQGPTC